jgi:hypothetical protein
MAKKKQTVERDEVVTEARQRYEYAKGAWAEIYRLARDDMRFSDPTSSAQWPDSAKADRLRDNRPCMTFDQVGQYVRQVVNQARRNRPAMDFIPVDDNSDPKLAEILQGLARQTEYESRAQVAYITALEHAVRGGIGYFRAVTEPKESEIEGQLAVRLLRVNDFTTVFPDPDFQEPDGSDMTFGFVEQMMPSAVFSKRYPDAEMSKGDSDGWFSTEHVRVCEYFRLVDGADGHQRCEWFKISGEEVLDKGEFPASYVPIFPVLGNEEWEDGKRRVCGLVRTARDAQISYNFERNAEFEAVAVGPKAPYLAPIEAIDGHEAIWQNANRGNVAVLPYNSMTEDGAPIQKPERINPAQIATGWAQLRETSRRDIQSAMGQFDSTVGNNPNQQSGRAVLALADKAETGTYHYIDNLSLTVAHCGRVLTQVWPRIYDQAQVIRILGEDDDAQFVRVDPQMPMAYFEAEDGTVVVNPGVGKYDVRATIGPAYQSRQAEAAAEIGELVNGNPQMMALLGDVWVKMRNFPGAERLARRLQAMLPPQVKAAEEGGQAPLPPEVQAALTAAQQEIQGLQQQLEEASRGVAQERLKSATQIKIAEINADSRRDVEELKGMVSMLVQRMTPPPQLVAEVAQDMNEGSEQGPFSLPQ